MLPAKEALKGKFEAICMDVIEQIILTNEQINKEQALERANLLLSFKQASSNTEPVEIAVYKKAVEEFEKASEEEAKNGKKSKKEQWVRN